MTLVASKEAFKYVKLKQHGGHYLLVMVVVIVVSLLFMQCGGRYVPNVIILNDNITPDQKIELINECLVSGYHTFNSSKLQKLFVDHNYMNGYFVDIKSAFYAKTTVFKNFVTSLGLSVPVFIVAIGLLKSIQNFGGELLIKAQKKCLDASKRILQKEWLSNEGKVFEFKECSDFVLNHSRRFYLTQVALDFLELLGNCLLVVLLYAYIAYISDLPFLYAVWDLSKSIWDQNYRNVHAIFPRKTACIGQYFYKKGVANSNAFLTFNEANYFLASTLLIFACIVGVFIYDLYVIARRIRFYCCVDYKQQFKQELKQLGSNNGFKFDGLISKLDNSDYYMLVHLINQIDKDDLFYFVESFNFSKAAEFPTSTPHSHDSANFGNQVSVRIESPTTSALSAEFNYDESNAATQNQNDFDFKRMPNEMIEKLSDMIDLQTRLLNSKIAKLEQEIQTNSGKRRNQNEILKARLLNLKIAKLEHKSQ